MSRPRLLDLFCGAGGCSVGYHRAGFDVVGVDLEPQPNYPYEFVQRNAIDALNDWEFVERFDAFHASPPCQAYTGMSRRFADARAAHPALIPQVRTMLEALAKPYVIENVVGARSTLNHPILLCGRGLGLGVARHRLFECSFPVFSVACACRGDELPVYGKLDGRRLWTRKDGSELRAAKTLEQARAAMGVDWMTWDELRESVPPAYTEHLSPYLLAALHTEAAA